MADVDADACTIPGCVIIIIIIIVIIILGAVYDVTEKWQMVYFYVSATMICAAIILSPYGIYTSIQSCKKKKNDESSLQLNSHS